MTDNRATRESERFKLFEWPQPILEIFDKKTHKVLAITTLEDAKMIRDSLNDFLQCISKEFGGEKE